MTIGKITEELLAEARLPQNAYDYAIRREKLIEHSKTMKTNPFGRINSATIKQEPIGYIQKHGRGAPNGYPSTNRAQAHARVKRRSIGDEQDEDIDVEENDTVAHAEFNQTDG